MSASRIVLLAVLVTLIAAFFLFDLGRFFSLDHVRSQLTTIGVWYEAHPWQTVLIYFVVYIVCVTLSVPGATVLTLAAGAIFGLLWGAVIVSFASSIGATLAFLTSRFLFRESVQRRFADKLKAINTDVEREGPFYLFTLRLVPAFPFFAINLLMGLTRMKTRTFYWVSQAGMLLGTIVYVNAGTQIAQIHSLHGILSPGLIFSFALLGIFPLAAKRIVDFFRARHVYAKWPKPSRFDRNLVVIGGGSAGLVAAYIGAAVKARVTLVEKHRMGGDCLHTGCIPSKALIRSAKLLSQIRRANDYGIRSATAEVDFAEVMERVQRVIGAVQPHDSVERYTGLGVECIQGEAKILSPWSVELTTVTGRQTLTARSIVIATGARPFVPAIPGIDEVGYVTSDTIWSLRVLPRRLVVLGGGPIGCELAQCFARLGSQVTVVEMLPRLMIREDPDISERVTRCFREEGIAVLVGHKAKSFRVENGEKLLIAEHEAEETQIAFDLLLVAVGRIANTTGYGLEALGIGTTRQHTVATDEYLATRYPNIYACGDVAGPYQFTHVGSHQAWYASVNALFGALKRFRADYSVIPWATFTDPEVARVGLNEIEAKEKGIAYEVTAYDLEELDRAIADSEARGLVKVLTAPGKDRILGATIVAEHAGDLITEYISAMKHGIGMNKILGTIHIYPTLAEANKYAAGNWKRAHVSARTLRWLDRYHTWMRG